MAQVVVGRAREGLLPLQADQQHLGERLAIHAIGGAAGEGELFGWQGHALAPGPKR